MEWNESFVFFVFIHFNKSLNFSQPRQLMNASLFFSLCAYQFFSTQLLRLLLFFRHFVFFFSGTHTTRAMPAFDCLESQDGAVSAFAFFHPNPYAAASVITVQTETNWTNMSDASYTKKPRTKARHISKSVKRQWNAQFVFVSFARWTRGVWWDERCVVRASGAFELCHEVEPRRRYSQTIIFNRLRAGACKFAHIVAARSIRTFHPQPPPGPTPANAANVDSLASSGRRVISQAFAYISCTLMYCTFYEWRAGASIRSHCLVAWCRQSHEHTRQEKRICRHRATRKQQIFFIL